MNEQTRFEICCHEAAHAVLAYVLQTRRTEGLHAIGDTAGWVDQGRMFKRNSRQTRERYENLIIVSAAGAQAGFRAKFIPWTITGTPPAHIPKPTAPVEKYRASTLTRLLKGGDEDCEPDGTFEERLGKAAYPGTWQQYIHWLHQRAAEVVKARWPTILEIGIALFHQDYVSRREFLAIVKKHKGAHK